MLVPRAVDYDNKIVSLKILAGGEQIVEILGKFLYSNEFNIVLSNPQALTVQYVDKKPQIAMMNFMVSGDNSVVEISKSRVLAISKASDAASQEFSKMK